MEFSKGGSIRVYRAKKFGILFFFIAYFVVQCAGQMNSSRGEYFPVFGWSLFTEVINPRWAVELEIIRIGDTVFPEPVNFFELKDYFSAAAARSSDVNKTAVQILNRLEREPEAAAALRRVFERRHFSDHAQVEYQFVIVKFDPIVRWRSGEVIERHVVKRFISREDQ